ncbi:hypothetical protein [Salinispora arenicola]|uniref:hypothetical protein n=1 Tax=Salinispora arenicola TaxID=168697 RepID=UPI0027DC8B7B|nr:hypothetical protein [Salinispora arenicola]
MSRNEAHAPSAELMEQMTGFYVSRAIFLATDLGMIDQLAREPGTGVRSPRSSAPTRTR